ncbi:MAG: hypothetical protein KKD69_01350 [Euryarchaeota archaeon]|nr:hypothetical protein [Euryarchaeota archaeon]MCG2728134.1 hypothetical protein [Candidatus Methanoperedenaceae archaeon]
MAEAKAKEKRQRVPGEVTCAYCKGTGKHHDEKCIVCDGKGKVEVVDTKQKCDYCKGNGYLMAKIPCTKCGGTGYTRPVNKQRLF